LGFEASAFPETPRGFGFLVPETERELEILGCQFVSSIFPERSPAGKVLLSVFMGGGRAPHLASQPDDTLQNILARDLNRVLGVREAPVWVYRVDWPAAIPQYTSAAFALHQQLDELEKRFSGLHFTGSYRSGISLPDTLLHARNLGLKLGNAALTQ
jgi:oxygen-dependent protoporphyrinogen oxidase